MNSLGQFVTDLWSSAKIGSSKTRAHFTLKSGKGGEFIKKQHYLQILINEMFLAAGRQWFINYSPVALISASYLYGTSTSPQAVPALVGPSLFLKYSKDIPEGVIIRNAPVTALNPYQGGALALTVIFSKVQKKNNADQVINVLEGFAGIADPLAPAISFSSYLKIARTILDGVQVMLNLPQTAALIGYNDYINPQIGQVLEPTFLVLIDEDQALIDPKKFWVIDSSLHYGDTQAAAKPYRANDFILIEIAQGTKRTDEQTLDFYPLWEQTQDLALRSSNDHFWDETKHVFNTLKRAIVASPDLTEPDNERLLNDYKEKIVKYRKEAAEEAQMPIGKGLDATEASMQKIADELDALDEL